MTRPENGDYLSETDLHQSATEVDVGFERATLKEHHLAKLTFVENKNKLLNALNQRLQENECGALYSLHYRNLLSYVTAIKDTTRKPYQFHPRLDLVCQKTERAKNLPEFGVNSPGMDLIHSKLAPEVILSRNNLVDVFERLSDKDQQSLAPKSIRLGASIVNDREAVEIDLWQLKRACRAADFLKSLPVDINSFHPSIYNQQIQAHLEIKKTYLQTPLADVYNLIKDYEAHAASGKSAAIWFEHQIFKPLLAVCIAARNNGDLALLKAIGCEFNPRGLLSSDSDISIEETNRATLFDWDLGGYYFVNWHKDAEYLFYRKEELEVLPADFSAELV